MLRKKKGPCTLCSQVRIQILRACALGFAVARLGAVLWFLELISESVAFSFCQDGLQKWKGFKRARNPPYRGCRFHANFQSRSSILRAEAEESMGLAGVSVLIFACRDCDDEL